MKNETIEFLIKNLKDDHIIKQRDFTADTINQEIIEKIRIKIKKRFKTMRWIMASTLILVLATFFYLNFLDTEITKIGVHIIRFWSIFYGMFIVNIFVSKEIWNSRRNLLIIDLFEKEIIN